MTGNSVAIANAGNALLDKIMGGEEDANPFADEMKKLENSYFGFFLKISGKTGDITYKDNETELELDVPAQFYVNVETMMKGWQCWVDNNPVDEVVELYLNKDALPSKGELPDHGPYGDEDGWSELLGLHMIYVNPDGAEDGSDDIAFTYNTTSGGGTKAIRLFLKEYMKKIRQHIGNDGQLMIPLVEFDIESFKSKKNHKIYFPTLTIIEWAEKSSFGTDFEFGGADDDENYDEEDGGDENDASNYDDGGDVTDIDADTGEPVEEAPTEETKPAPKGRGRGGRGKASGAAKTAGKHEKPQDSADKKPASRRGRRGTAK